VGLFADCEQWEREVRSQKQEVRRRESETGIPSSEARPQRPPRKLSYLESREFEQIEGKIVEAEQKLHDAQTEMQNPEGSSDRAIMQARYEAVLAAQAEVDQLYTRWAELESKIAG